jgi:dipeptidyl aminopeptidase/acylaminoacyl peptidase
MALATGSRLGPCEILARAAVGRLNPNTSLRLLDLARGTNTRFTLGTSISLSGTWSPDGNRIVFASDPGGSVYDLYEKVASGAKDEELLLKSSENEYPEGWSRDGRFLLDQVSDPETKKQIGGYPRSKVIRNRSRSCRRSSTTGMVSFRPTDAGSPTSLTNPAARTFTS